MLNLYDRTFGLELEFGDVEKNKIVLPNGYKWSAEERSIVNTNAKKSTPTGNYGGEMNTRPYLPTRKDIRELRGIIKECFQEGGVPMWNTGFDGHLYIGDLELEDIKKIFILGFYVSPLINNIFKLGEWFNVEHLVPTPTFDFVERVNNAKSIDALKNIFANSSNVGHYRFQINIMSYFKTKTLEFRIFNGTYNFRETLETIKFMYKFVGYALGKNIEDFRGIKTEEDFVREFEVKGRFAEKIPPLIFAENHKEATRNISKGFAPSKKILSAIYNDTGEKLITVNPFNYEAELALYKSKKIAIYNNTEFNDIVYRIAIGELEIEYEKQFAVLNGHKKEREEELALFFIFSRIQKYSIDTEYGANEFGAYVAKIEESIEKIRENATAMIDMFSKVEYRRGVLRDAINKVRWEGKESSEILYQQEYNSKANSAVTALKKNSNYETDFTQKEMSYKNIEEDAENVDKLLIVSKNDFLPYVKIAKDLDVTLYSTKRSYLGIRQVIDEQKNITINIPKDDFEIKDSSIIKIEEVKPTLFTTLQNRFVKKVTKFKQPRICYTITAGDVVLGAFGFDYSKGEEYSLFLLSDFCTNNDVRLLSKLILFIIRTTEAKRKIERKLIERVDNGYTKVYTTMPVSMKYRGAFKKVKTDTKKSLTYEFKFGSMGTIEDAVREYNKRRKSK